MPSLRWSARTQLYINIFNYSEKRFNKKKAEENPGNYMYRTVEREFIVRFCS